jgi:Flp pilus assembly protein TadB
VRAIQAHAAAVDARNTRAGMEMDHIAPRWRYTVFALIVWLCLVAYIVVTGNVYGYVIVALFGVFVVAPGLVIILGNRRNLRRLLARQDDAPAPDTQDGRADILVPLEQTPDANMLN